MTQSANSHSIPSDLKQVDALFAATLDRADCPSGDELLQYAFGLLPEGRFKSTVLHTQQCPHCKQELATLRAGVKADADIRERSFLERMVAAGRRIFHSTITPTPLVAAVALRGSGANRFQIQVADYSVTWVVEADAAGCQRLEGQVFGSGRRRFDGTAVFTIPHQLEVEATINKYGHFSLKADTFNSGTLLLELGEDVLSIPLE